MFVPEFEEAMNALPLGGISRTVGVTFRRAPDPGAWSGARSHVDPKQLREQARNVLREQKFEEAYAEWARELRARAYVEMREPPF